MHFSELLKFEIEFNDRLYRPRICNWKDWKGFFFIKIIPWVGYFKLFFEFWRNMRQLYVFSNHWSNNFFSFCSAIALVFNGQNSTVVALVQPVLFENFFTQWLWWVHTLIHIIFVFRLSWSLMSLCYGSPSCD